MHQRKAPLFILHTRLVREKVSHVATARHRLFPFPSSPRRVSHDRLARRAHGHRLGSSPRRSSVFPCLVEPYWHGCGAPPAVAWNTLLARPEIFRVVRSSRYSGSAASRPSYPIERSQVNWDAIFVQPPQIFKHPDFVTPTRPGRRP